MFLQSTGFRLRVAERAQETTVHELLTENQRVNPILKGNIFHLCTIDFALW